MPERPLVLFAAPTVADKERRYGGAPKYYFPSHSRQVSRLTPQFNVLQIVEVYILLIMLQALIQNIH